MTNCSLYHLNGCNSFFSNKSTQNGGLALFLRNSFTGFKLQNLSFKLPYIESLFIQVIQPVKFIIGIIYRPPNANFNEFLSSINDISDILVRDNSPCYLTGDLNVNLLRNDRKTSECLNLLYSYLFFPTVTKPTRVTSQSATLIDNIWTNNLEHHRVSGIYHISYQ